VDAASIATQSARATIAADPRTLPGFDKLSALEKYIEQVRYNLPNTAQITRRDLVDGSSMTVPSVDMRKSFTGGDSTDLMSISMALDATNPRRPVPGKQEWQLKTFTFPKSRATYMEYDLTPTGLGLAANAQSNMRQWDLAQLCPPLGQLDPAQWTQDERQYVHYLTRHAMGMPDSEIAFAALWAAYASNFALWQGQERSVPAAAYYALAAAHFEQQLSTAGLPTPRSTAITWMICGECHRLLGRFEDALRCFAQAARISSELEQKAAMGEQIDALHDPEKAMLELYFQLCAAEDSQLHRQPFTRIPEPPIGWYIDLLLPAINADLAVERDNWRSPSSPAEIREAITARIKAKRA
jgi:tetratricopeptide (TPR) repeat protein